MSGGGLSKEDVLRAIPRAVAPFSVYIGDVLRRDHAVRVAAGGKGHGPSPALILRRLKTLAADGLVEKSVFADGYYGFKWRITNAGRAKVEAG